MAISFRLPAYSNKHKFRPLSTGLILADYYTVNGGTHIFKIQTEKGIIHMNGASLYPDAQVLKSKIGFTIRDLIGVNNSNKISNKIISLCKQDKPPP